MNLEADTIAALAESYLRKVAAGEDKFLNRLQCNVTGEIELPTPKQFWFELVAALLSSQQRSTVNAPLDRFYKLRPFPLSLETYAELNDVQVNEILRPFRFHERITSQLRKNHDWLFGKGTGWQEIESELKKLLKQRNSAPSTDHKEIERNVAQLLADSLRGVGPKQSRNLLQALGLTRFEIPLDSRVVGWLHENLGWLICVEGLSDKDNYEDLLDRVQNSCESAGVLPTVFDAAAFLKGSTVKMNKKPTTSVGYVNRNGQVVIRSTGRPGTDHGQIIYQLGCSHCGHVYGANGSDIHLRKCPNCHDGAIGLPIG
jgi:N-glycosylase/DNA lyase